MSTAPQLRKMDAKINRLPNWFTIIIKKIQGTQGDTLKHFFSLFSQLVFGTKGVLLEDKNAKMSFITVSDLSYSISIFACNAAFRR